MTTTSDDYDEDDRPASGKTDDLGKLLLSKITWEWQRVDLIFRDLIPAVHPGKALRTYQNGAKRHKGVKPIKSENEQIASGARSILNARLGSHRDSGRVTIEVRDGERWVKFNERRGAGLQPGDPCPTCGQPFPGEAAAAAPEEREPAHPSIIDNPRGTVMKDPWARAAIGELNNNDVQIKAMLQRVMAANEMVMAAVEGLRSQMDDLREQVQDTRELTDSGLSDHVHNLSEMVEVLEAEVNSAKVDTAGIVESSKQMAARVTDVESSLVRLVSRLSGAVSAKEVFELEREH